MSIQYIQSASNRIFVRRESDSNDLLEMTTADLAPALQFEYRSDREQLLREDKNGLRSRMAVTGPVREIHQFFMKYYGTGWSGEGRNAVIALTESALWNPAVETTAVEVIAAAGNQVSLAGGANLNIGTALGYGGEIRFIQAILAQGDYQLNAPFSIGIGPGAILDKCLTLQPGDVPQRLAILDDWAPSTAVKRLLKGAVVDRLTIGINNEFLEMEAYGYAQKMFDNGAGDYPEGQLFPTAPVGQGATWSQPIPGHLGQVLIGQQNGRLCTLTAAKIEIDNKIEARSNEFGCYEIKSFVPGKRKVTVSISVYQRTDEMSRYIFDKASRNEPISVMIQIGNQPGSLFAAYLPSVLFPTPEFDDSKARLVWHFSGGMAIGGINDEIFLAMK
jgi:hypothetical protein